MKAGIMASDEGDEMVEYMVQMATNLSTLVD